MCFLPQSVFPSLLCLMYVIPTFVETLGCMSIKLAVSVFTSCPSSTQTFSTGFTWLSPQGTSNCPKFVRGFITNGALTVSDWSLKFSGFQCAQSLSNQPHQMGLWCSGRWKLVHQILPEFFAEFQWPRWNVAAPSISSQCSVYYNTFKCWKLGGNEHTCLLKGVKNDTQRTVNIA